MTPSTASSIAAQRLEVVGELASLINTTFDLRELFREAIVRLNRVLPFRRASVVMVSDDRTEYALHTLYDAAKGGFVEAKGAFPIDLGLTGEVIRTGTAVRTEAVSGLDGIRIAGEHDSISVLLVPLKLEGQVIGTLNLGAQEANPYTDDDLELATLLGRQVETSLHYSKLLATIEQHRAALAQQQLLSQAERSRLGALIEASDAAIMMESGGDVAYVNRAMAELLGRAQRALPGASVDAAHELLKRRLDEPSDLEPQVAALRHGATLRDRVKLNSPVRATYQRTVAPVRNENGELLGNVLIFRDITTEAESEAAKDEFVSIVSHELRTPLTSIKTSLALLMQGAAGELTDQMREFVTIALRNLERLVRLVEDLLDLSRIESGRIVTKLEPVALSDATQRALESVTGFAEEREVELIVPPEDDTLVLADLDRLAQVLVNLLSNAIKFSPPRKPVELTWRVDGATVVIEVSDRGPGIFKEQLEVIFDKFRQLEFSGTRPHEGAGLGLAIARGIVEEFGGDMWAESEPGRGSRFLARLLLAQERTPVAVPDTLPREAGRTLLIVEADADLGRLYAAQFATAGWRVRTVADGAEALDVAQAHTPNVITVGVELKDMHGLELLERLRHTPATVDVPIIMCGPGSEPTQAIAYGADARVAGDSQALVNEAERLAAAPRRRVVLVVEDNPAVRSVVTRLLRLSGYACLDAPTAAAGLELARARTPDLIVTDFVLPGMNGLEMLRHLRGDEALKTVPAVVISARAEADVIDEIRSLNARFVAKPFQAATIISEIKQVLEGG
jgi:PAS domain S-box-containing protein